MSTVWVESYIKYGERFVPIDEATDPAPDGFYIEGALCISIYGQPFLTLAHADLVDQLWLYIVDGLHKLREGEAFETYFPDQPTLLLFRPLGPKLLLLTVQSDAGKCTVQANRYELLNALCKGAHRFFDVFATIVPHHSFDLHHLLVRQIQ